MLYDTIQFGKQLYAVLLKWAAVAQSVVRRIGSAEVTGPIPVSSLKEIENKGFSRKILFEMSLFLFCYSNH